MHSRFSCGVCVMRCRYRTPEVFPPTKYTTFPCPCLHAPSGTVTSARNFVPLKGTPICTTWSHCDLAIGKPGEVNIIIKNLDKRTDNKVLLDTFSGYGSTISCKVAVGYGSTHFEMVGNDGGSRGLGVVNSPPPEEAAAATEEGMSGKTVGESTQETYAGRPHTQEERSTQLKKNFDTLRAELQQDYQRNDQEGANLFVKNQDDDQVDDEKLQAELAPSGTTTSNYGSIILCKVAVDSDGESKGEPNILVKNFVTSSSPKVNVLGIDGGLPTAMFLVGSMVSLACFFLAMRLPLISVFYGTMQGRPWCPNGTMALPNFRPHAHGDENFRDVDGTQSPMIHVHDMLATGVWILIATMLVVRILVASSVSLSTRWLQPAATSTGARCAGCCTSAMPSSNCTGMTTATTSRVLSLLLISEAGLWDRAPSCNFDKDASICSRTEVRKVKWTRGTGPGMFAMGVTGARKAHSGSYMMIIPRLVIALAVASPQTHALSGGPAVADTLLGPAAMPAPPTSADVQPLVPPMTDPNIGRRLQTNVCMCANGVAATGPSCAKDKAVLCTTCNAGFVLNSTSSTCIKPPTCAAGFILDRVAIKCATSITCGFDKDAKICGWTSDRTGGWTRGTKTPSSSFFIPMLAQSGSYFMFTSQFAAFTSPQFSRQFSASIKSMSFYYHVYGSTKHLAHKHTLTLYQNLGGGAAVRLSTVTGRRLAKDSGPWSRHALNLPPYVKQVYFLGRAALDTVTFATTDALVCTCANGTAAKYHFCVKDKAEVCDRCSAKFHLNGSSCVKNPTCTCANGIAATFPRCVKDKVEVCSSCSADFHLNGSSCVKNPTCTCANGIGATSQRCVKVKEICATCNAGFLLDSTSETCKVIAQNGVIPTSVLTPMHEPWPSSSDMNTLQAEVLPNMLSGVADEPYCFGAVAGDFNGDGAQDLYILVNTVISPSFADPSFRSGWPGFVAPRPNRLFFNDGTGNFTEVQSGTCTSPPPQTPVPPPPPAGCKTCNPKNPCLMTFPGMPPMSSCLPQQGMACKGFGLHLCTFATLPPPPPPPSQPPPGGCKNPAITFFSNCTCGAVVADWNADGFADLFVMTCCPEDDGRGAFNKLFINDQTGNFIEQNTSIPARAPYAGLGSRLHPFAAHTSITGDGINGRLYQAAASAGDFNNDGVTDLQICAFQPSSGKYKQFVYLSDGNATFGKPHELDFAWAAGSTGVDIIGGRIAPIYTDWNNDGVMDVFIWGVHDLPLAKPNVFGGMLLTYAGKDLAKWRSQGLGRENKLPPKVPFAKLAFIPMQSFQPRNPKQRPATAKGLEVLMHITKPVAADFNNDGYMDLFVTYAPGSTDKAYLPGGFIGSGQLFIMAKDGTFSARRNAATRGMSTHVNAATLSDIGTCTPAIVGDFNGDTFLDIYIVTYRLDMSARNKLFINDKSANFIEVHTSPAVLTENWDATALAADFLGDKAPELYVMNYGEAVKNQLVITRAPFRLVDDGALQLSSTSVANKTDTDESYEAVVRGYIAADWNLDGAMDIFLAERCGTLLINDQNGSFHHVALNFSKDLSKDLGWRHASGLVTDDWNQDGWPDLYVVMRFQPNRLFINDRHNGFVERSSVTATSYPSIQAISADWNGDGAPDLYVVNGVSANANGVSFSANANELFINGGNANFTELRSGPAVDNSSKSSVKALAGDFNVDGALDIYLVTPADDPMSGRSGELNQLLINDKSAAFTQLTDSPAVIGTRESAHAAAGDFNADGAMDLFIVTQGQTSFDFTTMQQVYTMTPNRMLFNRNGSFVDVGTGPPERVIDIIGGLVQVGSFDKLTVEDLNGDGAADVVAGLVVFEIFLSNKDGSFTKLDIAEAAMSISRVLVDWNMDGIMDSMLLAAPKGLVGLSGKTKLSLLLGDVCPDGFASLRPKVGSGLCLPCPLYSTDAGLNSATGCQLCPAGRIALKPAVSASERFYCIPCSAGRYRPRNARVAQCLSCAPGRYASAGAAKCAPAENCIINRARTLCTACPAGKQPNQGFDYCEPCIGFSYSQFGIKCQPCDKVVNANRTACVACAAGKEPAPDRTACQTCSGTKYSTAGTCLECPRPNVVNIKRTACTACPSRQASIDGINCVCQDGYYNQTDGVTKCISFNGEYDSSYFTPVSGETCVPCDSCVICTAARGMAVSGGHQLSRSGLRNRAVFECPLGDTACTGSSCESAYEGPLCNNCADNFGRSGLQGPCDECSGSVAVSWAILISGVLVAEGLVLAVLLLISKDNNIHHRFIPLAKITLGMFQILSSVGASFKVQLPKVFQTLIRFMKLFALNLFSILPIGCIGSYTFIHQLTLAILLPLTLLVGIGAIYVMKRTTAGIEDVVFRMASGAMYLVWPFVTHTIFQTFNCRSFDDEVSFLAIDYHISCDDASYTVLAVVAAFAVIVYPIGVPFATLLLLYQNRAAIKSEDAAICGRYSFFLGDYKPQQYYWDCVEMLRKVAITGLIANFLPGSLLQLNAGIILCCMSGFASAWFLPYKDTVANVFKVTTEGSLAITLILCTLLKHRPEDLEKEGLGENFIGICLVVETVVLPAVGLLVSAMVVPTSVQ
jgi:hypothetical protein